MHILLKYRHVKPVFLSLPIFMLKIENIYPKTIAYAMFGIFYHDFLFVWVEALRPSQQFFSHFGTEFYHEVSEFLIKLESIEQTDS